MRVLGGDLGKAVAQARTLVDRAALGLLVALAVGLLALSKTDVKLANYLVEHGGDLAAPALGPLAGPIAALRARAADLGGLLAVFEENRRLREENRRLLTWQAEAARLTVQNRSLRGMLAIPAAEPATAQTTARVIGDTGGPFVHAVLIDAGQRRGLRDGMAAVTPEGLAGMVVDVGRNSARVLLLTDFNAKIPAVVERTGDRAILCGDNTREPDLRFLPLDPGYAVGDRVLTSGDGGLLPAGLVIGRITAIGPDKVAVRPAVDWARLDYVSVLLASGVPEPGLDQPAPASR